MSLCESNMAQSKMLKFKMATMTHLRQLGLSFILCELFGLVYDIFIETNMADFNMAAMTHLRQLDL